MILMDITPEAVNSWFTPFHYIVYLGTLFVLMVVYYQWKWAKICKNNIQVLVAQQGGGGNFVLAPKTGGEVTIKNPHTNTTRTWPVNELSTIDVLYPGVGFVPAFLQKTIRMAIVSEGDWEPLLNRSPHLEKVASPDMVVSLTEIAETADEITKKAIIKLLNGVSTSPTREMIASPAVLGNLIHEKITELVATVSKDIMSPLTEAIKKLGQRVNPTIVYIGLGLIIILLVYTVFQLAPVIGKIDEFANTLDAIQKALGVVRTSY